MALVNFSVKEPDLVTPADSDYLYVERAAQGNTPLKSFRLTVSSLLARFATLVGLSVDPVTSNLKLPAGLSIGTGTDNAAMGTASGTFWTTVGPVRRLTVANTRVTASSIIFLTFASAGDGSALGQAAHIKTKTVGASFTIESFDTNEDRDISWLIIEPYAL